MIMLLLEPILVSIKLLRKFRKDFTGSVSRKVPNSDVKGARTVQLGKILVEGVEHLWELS